MNYVSCLTYLNAVIQDQRPNQSKIIVKLSDVLLEQEIIIDVFIICDNNFYSITAVESGAIMTGFISNNPFDEYDRYDNDNEFIFLVDCSVTMKDNDSIELARQVLQRFLKILPVNCQFNIIRFGSTFHFLFDRTITDENSTSNNKKAKKFIDNLKADLNGIDLIEPLKWLYRHPPKLNKSREILLLTGSQISNVEEPINLCRKMSIHSRIFTVGLGLSSNPVLIKELARVTNGKSILIPPNARVEFYIADQLQRILHFSFSNINIRSICPSNKNPIQFIAPIYPPNIIFSETRFLVYALLDETQPLDHEIKIQLIENRTPRERCLATASIDHIPVINGEQDKIITRLAARAVIQSLADLDNEGQILMRDLSLKFGILCPLTTFVGRIFRI